MVLSGLIELIDLSGRGLRTNAAGLGGLDRALNQA
jgi:hypothetical protein